jgi:capsular exopolysaccharide synthesis family protein
MSNSLQHHDQFSQSPGNGLEYNSRDDFYKKDNNSLDPHKILSYILKYKWIILLFILVGSAGAWLYANTITPVYKSTGTLMITSVDQSPSDELSKMISQTTGYGTSSTFKNELQVLHSNKFYHRVAQELLEDEPENVEQYPIYWKEAEDGELVRTKGEEIAGRIGKNIDFYQADEEADVIDVNYESSSPEEAAKIVNVAMQNYVDHSTQQNRQAATSTADFLEEEKEKLKTKLQNAEQQLRNYMDATGFVQVDEQASSMVGQRANTEVELQYVTLELQTIEKSIADYNKQLDRISPGLAEQLIEAVSPRLTASQEMLARYKQERALIVSKNPGVLQRDPLPSRLQYLDKQTLRLKREIKNLSAKLFTTDNEFTGINSEDRAEMLSNVQGRLVELRMQRDQLESKKQSLTQQKTEMDAEFDDLPRGIVELAKLKRDVRINEELYVNVSRQYADMSLLEQSQYGFGRIVDSADTPNVPVSPNKKILMLLGLMIGGVLSAGFIAIREFRDNSVNNIGELKTIYLPPLAVIPVLEKIAKGDEKSFKKGEGTIPEEIVMLNNRFSFAAEAFRRLKNTIIFQDGEHPPKSIVITSPEKGDGKSTVSANLAISFAEEGYLTLVIDADFRRPKLQKYFGITDELGLSNYLNHEISFENLLKETDLETLKLITGGRVAEMPDILSNNHKFKRLLKKLEDIFDVIIIDTPPYGIISDSSALMKYAEAIIMVVQYQKTNKGLLFKTMEELKQIGANVTHIVLNKFDHRNEISNYYGDGYYQAMYSSYEQYL